MFTGKFCAAHIGDGLLELNNYFWPPKEPLLAYFFKSFEGEGFSPRRAKGTIKIAPETDAPLFDNAGVGRIFPIVGYKYGWGNWCWDLVIVTPEVAVDVINYLKSLDCFRCEAGVEDFFDTFNDEGAILEKTEATLAMLRENGWQRP
jgi:hypothetical protein